MENVIASRKYLKQEKNSSNLILVILIGVVIGTFILMLYVPQLFLLNPMAIFLLLGYVYVMYKKFRFIKVVEGILNSDENENRLHELYVNLGGHIDGIKVSVPDTRKLWAGERSYSRAETNKYLIANIDYRITKSVYEIYNKK
jgi:uncharacterized membrane protein